jgi:hypothetical protein
MTAQKLSKRILEGMLIGALTFGNVGKLYAPPFEGAYELAPVEVSYRKLSDSKDLRAVTKDKKSRNIRRVHPTIVSYAGETDTLYIPEYVLNESGVPSTHCSRYVRKMTKDVFGLDYPQNEAWKIRDGSEIVKSSNKGFTKDEVGKMIENREIHPGMIFGFYNPESSYNKKGRLYTHVGGLVGIAGEIPLVSHQFGKETKVDSLDWFYGKGMKLMEILDVPKEKN